MYFSPKSIAAFTALVAVNTNAFSVAPTGSFSLRSAQMAHSLPSMRANLKTPVAPLFAMADTQTTEVEDEVQRMKTMAAKLRGEAAELETGQAQQRADAASRDFQKFDTNKDGEISLDELKAGLEKTFKLEEIPESRVKILMDSFDKSGDGKLQFDEFVGVNQFGNKLEALVRDEKSKAREATKVAADATKVAADEKALVEAMEAQLELINDKPPTGTDKLVSVLPYLVPLLDGLALGRFVLEGAGGDANPVVHALAIMYTIYRSIPLGSLIAYFSLNAFSNNLSINRLVRYNMKQAIFVDIALIIPGLLAAITTAAAPALGLAIPAGLGELGSDAAFVALVATLGYSTISSLLGATPDKVPFISDNVNRRIPSKADFLDSEGRLDVKFMQPREMEDMDNTNSNDDKKD